MYVHHHRGGVIDQLSDDGFLSVRRTAVGYCRQRNGDTILQATLAMYDRVRGLESTMVGVGGRW